MIIGNEINNVMLDGVNSTEILYPEPQQAAEILNSGPGDIHISWRRIAVIGDVNCLKLPAGASFSVRSASGWNVLSLIGSGLSAVQVVTR